MKYQVVVTERAELQLREVYDWWAEHRSRAQAIRWYRGIYRAILELRSSPDRKPTTAEQILPSETLHELRYGLGHRKSHRAVYVIRDNQVVALLIRHLAQDALSPGDI